MAKETLQNDSAAVSEHLTKLPSELADIVNQIRTVVLATDSRIGERIKWNSPSFFFMGELPDADPKTYPRDIAVCNLHRGYVLLVLPTGSKITDNFEILEGSYTDGRRLVTFKTLADVNQKSEQLQACIRQWLRLLQP